MNVLFLTIVHKENIESHGIYTDLLRQFRDNGHNVYIASPYEKRIGKKTEYQKGNGVHMLHVSIGNITKCGVIEKGISTITIERKYLKAIKTYFKDVQFDLVLYPTPPITLVNVVKYIKKRDNAKTYLLLKDIFPQNAVDLGMIKKDGFKGLIYKYFRAKEKKLYAISDHIGCMSQANVDYVLKNNPEIVRAKVCISPNCIEPIDILLTQDEMVLMRNKYNLPVDKKIFVYGGNLGKPQGIPFLIECIRTQKFNSDVFFLIVGDGTEYSKIEEFINKEKQENVRLMRRLPKDDYDRMVASCDVGMLFLDYRFTIPNFPSRLLSYMQAGIPVLACTDSNTDIGKIITEGEIGWWCESDEVGKFARLIPTIVETDIKKMNYQIYKYLDSHFNVKYVYKDIVERL